MVTHSSTESGSEGAVEIAWLKTAEKHGVWFAGATVYIYIRIVNFCSHIKWYHDKCNATPLGIKNMHCPTETVVSILCETA